MARRRALFKIVKEVWPELIFAAFMGLFLLIRAKDSPLFVVFVIIITGIGWAMGWRHRNTEHQRNVREILTTTRRIEDRGLGEPGPQDTSRPLARVLPLRRR